MSHTRTQMALTSVSGAQPWHRQKLQEGKRGGGGERQGLCTPGPQAQGLGLAVPSLRPPIPAFSRGTARIGWGARSPHKRPWDFLRFLCGLTGEQLTLSREVG